MKRLLLFILFVALLPATALLGQKPFTPEITVGVKGGTTLSRLRVYPNFPKSNLLGYTAGVTFRHITEKHFGYQVGLNLMQLGWKEDFSGEIRSDYYYQRTINYLTLPFTSHLYFGNETVRVIFNIGAQVGYAIGNSVKTNIDSSKPITGLSPTRITEQYQAEITNKFDYGIIGGIGMEVRTKIGFFALEGGYYFGLADIFPNRKADYFASSGNQSIYITLAYLFRLK